MLAFLILKQSGFLVWPGLIFFIFTWNKIHYNSFIWNTYQKLLSTGIIEDSITEAIGAVKEKVWMYWVYVAAAAKSLQSCPTLCDPIDGSPPGSPRPWDSPGKNTGVGCHFLLQCTKVKSEREVPQSCPTLSDPMDCITESYFTMSFGCSLCLSGKFFLRGHTRLVLYVDLINLS